MFDCCLYSLIGFHRSTGVHDHANTLQLRFLLQIPSDTEVRFDRFSDSAGVYVTLDATNPAIYKQLYRAAKAKLKLRLKATILPEPRNDSTPALASAQPLASASILNFVPEPSKRNTYLETVLSKPAEEQPFSSFTVAAAQQPTAVKRDGMLSKATLSSLNDFCGTTFSIDCNNCGLPVSDEHYHCSKCENGDYDLCPACIAKGVTCDGEDHWLIKRTVKNGKVLCSNTLTLPPKSKESPAPSAVEEDQRTCNSCIIRKCSFTVMSISILTTIRTRCFIIRDMRAMSRLRPLFLLP